ncbi:MAG: hypothetical protein NVSMB13_01720 [Mycobacteriales bacterium]
MTADVAMLLRQAGLPADNLLTRRNALPAPVQALHRRALLALAASGEPAIREELTGWADELRLDLDPALRTLAEAELVFLDPAGRRVAGGVPFAAEATAHQVRIVDGPTVWANCAVDALGIAAMIDCDLDIRSTDPHTGETVTADSRAGRWTWSPSDAVVFIGSSGEGRVTDSCCPVINFFAAADHAGSYQRQHALAGVVLALPDAAQAGALIFGNLLREPAVPS